MRRLPPAFLTLPPPGDRALPALVRKVRLLGVRALLTTPGVPFAGRLRRELEADGPGTLDRVGAADVLPRLLCLAAGIAREEALDGLETLYDSPSPSFAVGAGAHLAAADTFPMAHLEAHPDKDGNALDLGDRSPEDWVDALRSALGIVAAALPEWDVGIRPHVVGRWVPVGCDDREHRSASYREAPGLAYLTLHPDPLTMAEAVLHEAQHSALNLLSWFDPLLDDADDVLVTSPVRPDPRPLRGVLLAAHAFVPVAAMHLRLAEAEHGAASGDRFAVRRAEVLRSNEDALAILEARAHPTSAGRRVLRDLRGLQDAVVAATPEAA